MVSNDMSIERKKEEKKTSCEVNIQWAKIMGAFINNHKHIAEQQPKHRDLAGCFLNDGIKIDAQLTNFFGSTLKSTPSKFWKSVDIIATCFFVAKTVGLVLRT